MGKASRAKRERPPVRTLYHFTSIFHLGSIERDGVLRTTDSQVPGQSVVWFLDEPNADGASHGLEGSAVDKRAVRITVHARAVRWLDWVKTQPIEPWWLEAIVGAGGGPEAAAHWYISTEPVPRSQWVSVEARENDTYKGVDTGT